MLLRGENKSSTQHKIHINDMHNNQQIDISNDDNSSLCHACQSVTSLLSSLAVYWYYLDSHRDQVMTVIDRTCRDFIVSAKDEIGMYAVYLIYI